MQDATSADGSHRFSAFKNAYDIARNTPTNKRSASKVIIFGILRVEIKIRQFASRGVADQISDDGRGPRRHRPQTRVRRIKLRELELPSWFSLPLVLRPAVVRATS